MEDMQEVRATTALRRALTVSRSPIARLVCRFETIGSVAGRDLAFWLGFVASGDLSLDDANLMPPWHQVPIVAGTLGWNPRVTYRPS